MGEDPRATDERSVGHARLREGGSPARRTDRGESAVEPVGRFGPVAVDEPALVRWGEAVGRQVRRPAWFALRGDLGAGKSVLARAVARGAGVNSPMPSPTFNLVFRYDVAGGPRVWHLDLYRLVSEAEVWELGWQDLGVGDEIVLVEWPERAESLQAPDRWDLRLESHPTDSRLRLLTAEPMGLAPPVPFPPDAHD